MNSKNNSTYHKLSILDGLELLNAKNHTIDFPFHTRYLQYCIDPGAGFQCKTSRQVPAGTLSITNPYEVHATPCDDRIGNSFFTFYVSPEVLKKLNNGNDVFLKARPFMMNIFLRPYTSLHKIITVLRTYILRISFYRP